MTDQELKDLVASLAVENKETSLQMKETDRRMQENDRILTEKFAETDRMIKELSRRMGGIDENQGHHAEQFFQNVFAEKPVFGSIKYDNVMLNLRTPKIEFDIVLVNGNSVALIEVKNRIHPKFVKELAEERVKKFKEHFPIYKNFRTRLGIAGFSFSEKALAEAKKYGIGLIRQVGDSVEISAERLRVY